MVDGTSTDYQCSIIIDILADMVINYLAKNEDKLPPVESKEEGTHAD
ncbi:MULTISPECIES: hypothetical protein [Anoxybacillaceae]|nr:MULTISPECIES: hypothetical protein [Bacillaceae]WMT20053.1 hypothetical protein RFB12_05555 [Parageobacillus toebii]